MAPVKITCTVGGKERESITAPDNVTAVLETPAGDAIAYKRLPRFGHQLLDLRANFGTKFPGDSEVIYPDSRHVGAASRRRRAEYQTKEGRVVIEAEVIKK